MESRFSVPLLQLGADLMDEESWTSMIIHQGKGNLPDEIEGNHGCRNSLVAGDPHVDSVGCVGNFCVRWEKNTYNGQRKGCYAREVDEEADDKVDYICIPDLDIPCILGRTHTTHKELQRQFLTNFNSIRRKNNPHGKSPFCRKEFIVDIGLRGILKDANLNALIKHMTLNHSTSLALLKRSGKFKTD